MFQRLIPQENSFALAVESPRLIGILVSKVHRELNAVRMVGHAET